MSDQERIVGGETPAPLMQVPNKGLVPPQLIQVPAQSSEVAQQSDTSDANSNISETKK